MELLEPMGRAFLVQLRDRATPPERAIVGLFRVRCAGGPQPVVDRLPIFVPATDLVDFAFHPGRARITIHHADGSATVIEVRDGASGFDHVFDGIGQTKLDGIAVAVAAGTHQVRRALLWTSVDNVILDAIIELACGRAGVIPLPWASLKTHLAALVLDPKAVRGHAQARRQARARRVVRPRVVLV